MSRRAIVISIALVAAAAGWYAFRPERAFLNRHVQEAGPAEANAAEVLLTGMFHSNAHPTRGTATVLRLADGRRVLRFTEFATSDGPDVQIYLVKAADVNDEKDVTTFVNLGAMKGNIGDQNYDIPADVDLASYRAVSVWCRRFAVNFGAAPLAVGRYKALPDGQIAGTGYQRTYSDHARYPKWRPTLAIIAICVIRISIRRMS